MTKRALRGQMLGRLTFSWKKVVAKEPLLDVYFLGSGRAQRSRWRD